MKINRRETSGKVSISSPMTAGKEMRRPTSGAVTTQGKTKVTSGPAANGPCAVTSIAGRRLGHGKK